MVPKDGYEKINNDGAIMENSIVNDKDIIMAKIVPIKENRNDHTKVIKYQDQSLNGSASVLAYFMIYLHFIFDFSCSISSSSLFFLRWAVRS